MERCARRAAQLCNVSLYLRLIASFVNSIKVFSYNYIINQIQTR